MSTPQTSVQQRTMYAWNSISKRGPFRSDSSSLPKNSSSSSSSNKQQVHQKSRNHHETTSTLKAGDTLPQSTMSRSQPPGSMHSHHSVSYNLLKYFYLLKVSFVNQVSLYILIDVYGLVLCKVLRLLCSFFYKLFRNYFQIKNTISLPTSWIHA